jgi:hypothetical protein
MQLRLASFADQLLEKLLLALNWFQAGNSNGRYLESFTTFVASHEQSTRLTI